VALKLNISEKGKAWKLEVPEETLSGKLIGDKFDGKEIKPEIAQEVVKELVGIIKKDGDFNKLIKYRIFIMWTGNSFHVYLLLKKPVNLDFYSKYLAYHKDNPAGSFTGRWAAQIKEKTGMNVQGGHEKTSQHIIIDPSGTPSGKLATLTALTE